MRSHRLPAELIVANDDPILIAGARAATGSDRFPILICHFGTVSEMILGWKPEEYNRVEAAFSTFASASAPSLFGSGQQSSGQASPEAPKDSTGAN